MFLCHIREVCGKDEVLTPEQAHDQGWDYPPKMGQFKVVSSRTCGNGTIWWAMGMEGKQVADFSEKQLETFEPESIAATN